MPRKSMLGANKFQLEAEEVTIRDSTINFNTGSFTRRLSSVVKCGRPKVKMKAQSFDRDVANNHLQNPKSGGKKGGEHHS